MRLATVLLAAVAAALLTTHHSARAVTPAQVYVVVVYGGTSGGVAAAVQARRMGKTAILIEPTTRLGGLSSGGLGQTDIGNKAAIGGISREFYQRVRKHYRDPAAWRWQKPEEYKDSGQTRTGADEDTKWTFEPSAALKIFNDLVKEHDVPVAYKERLNRQAGVKKENGRIVSITTESGKTFAGRTFIDATYEGDLMAAAGVSYTVGREANSQYGETYNGVQVAGSKNHQLRPGIDPYVKKGDPASGLLPFIDPKGPGEEFSGDKRVQAYCYRMCLTNHPENRTPFHKPTGYDELWYELLLRNFEAGEAGMPWINSTMPNRKTDTNNRTGVSTDFIGQNYDYPEASYDERAKIAARHLLWQQGLMWTLANHPRVPEKIRKEFARWGMTKDEFTEGSGWQEQLYVREARRMVADLVMTQAHCQGKQVVDDPAGLAAYTMDSHNVQRHVDKNGHARNEGNIEIGGFGPYPIGYKSIVPKKAEAANLLVPVCLSATHIAYGSIRMEPVFMVLGQTAATAACMAVDQNVAVQDLPYANLRDKLLADKQVLEWKGPKGGPPAAAAIDPKSLPGVVVDDDQAKLTGGWTAAAVVRPFVGTGYRHDGNAEKGTMTARYEAKLPTAGRYEIRLAYTTNANRATNVPVTVTHAGGESAVKLDQQKSAKVDGSWHPIGTFEFAADRPAVVTIVNAGTDGHVILDAVQFVPAK